MQKELIDVIREVRQLCNMQRDYLVDTPQDVNAFLHDNEYASYQEIKMGIFEQALFGEHLDMVRWFLHKFEPRRGRRNNASYIDNSGVKHTFTCDEDVLDYMAANC